jgi:UPF0755 protein
LFGIKKRSWLFFLLMLGAGGALIFQDMQRLLAQPLLLTQTQRVDIETGKSLAAALADLEAEGFFAEPRVPLYLRLQARIAKQATALKAGEYQLEPGMNSLDLLSLIVSGKTVLHELRLIEGWTFAEALTAMRGSGELVHTLKDADADRIMSAIGRAGMNPEGRFFPDTYFFPKGTTDEAFLRRASAAMDNVLQQEWQQRQPDLPYQSAAEALIMASIIEKETAIPAERAQIAGVFVRRLLKGMKLQTDPTVIYGLGEDYDGDLRRRDLETDTPYNTYTRAGLPPTPICLPGRASIHAALHPAPGNSIFFVSRNDGTHQFSETLDQHNSAVQKFQIGKRR